MAHARAFDCSIVFVLFHVPPTMAEAVKAGHGSSVNWNWGAIPMDASQKKRPPAKAHRLWCNVDPTTILNWLSTDQCLFAQEEVDVLEAHGIVHRDGAC